MSTVCTKRHSNAEMEKWPRSFLLFASCTSEIYQSENYDIQDSLLHAKIQYIPMSDHSTQILVDLNTRASLYYNQVHELRILKTENERLRDLLVNHGSIPIALTSKGTQTSVYQLDITPAECWNAAESYRRELSIYKGQVLRLQLENRDLVDRLGGSSASTLHRLTREVLHKKISELEDTLNNSSHGSNQMRSSSGCSQSTGDEVVEYQQFRTNPNIALVPRKNSIYQDVDEVRALCVNLASKLSAYQRREAGLVADRNRLNDLVFELRQKLTRVEDDSAREISELSSNLSGA